MPKFNRIEHNAVRYIPMDFNNSIVKDKFKGIKASEIRSISLVYTKFKLSETFNQMQLNANRTKTLYSIIPGLSKNKEIQWNWIGQTGCRTPEGCTDYFHGFVIQLNTATSMAKTYKEDKMMDYYIEKYTRGRTTSKYLDSLTKLDGASLIYVCDTVRWKTTIDGNKLGKVRASREKSKKKLIKKLNKYIDKESEFITIYLDKKKRITNTVNIPEKRIAALKEDIQKYYSFGSTKLGGRRCNSSIQMVFVRDPKKDNIVDLLYNVIPLNLEFEPILNFDIKYLDHEEINCQYIDTAEKLKTTEGEVYVVKDEVVLKVMERIPSFENALIATDVTGSMYSYLGQFLAWHNMNLANTRKKYDFVFFNDGDNMLDQLKITGRVGGIYYVKTDSFETVKRTLVHAKNNGDGGDGPENNIEAILHGIKQNPRIKSVILIADNNATPRDLELLNKVRVPIRVILCGSSNGVNPKYLNMVRENGGSIHTIENDLTNLSKLKDGEKLELEGRTYILKGGKFEILKK